MSEHERGSGFSIPKFEEEDKPKRGNRRVQKPAQKAASKLIDALNFVSEAADTSSKQLFMQHVRFINGWAIATNGMMRAGHPIEEDLALCPHIGHLKNALARAGSTVAMAPLDNGRLSITGGKFKAIVPCLPGEALPAVMIDPNIAPIADEIKTGFKAVLALAKEDAERLVECTLLLRANSVVGCNGNLMLEYWHGIDLPPGLNIPQAFAKAVTRVNKPLVGFGYTPGRSVTFYFEGGCWLATQLGEGEWPANVDELLNAPTPNIEDCPPHLFDGLDAILSFSADGAVHFHDDKLKTTYAIQSEGEAVYGAAYDVPGLAGLYSFTGKLLKLAQSAAVRIDYRSHDDRMIMYGDDKLRGVLMKRIA